MHVTGAALGVSALIATSAGAYTALKLVGMGYLLYLGARMLIAPMRDGGQTRERGSLRDQPFAQGLVCNALNPKVALFFVTFLPHFLPDRGPVLPTALALSALFAALYLVWFSGLVALVERAGSALRGPRVAAWAERITGGVLVAFAVRLAAERRP